MKKFTFIDNNKTIKDYLYSELMVLALFNPDFYNFLDDEKNRYIMNDKVFENDFIYNIRNYNVIYNDVTPIFPISIEKDWEILKTIRTLASKCQFNFSTIELSKGKLKLDDILIWDGNEFNLPVIEINMDSLIKEFIVLLKSYLLPKYENTIIDFLDMIKEMNIEITYDSIKNIKTKGLGFRFDELPKLYYNNLFDYILDIWQYAPGIRDYQLFLDIWDDRKKTLLKQIILPCLNGIDEEFFKNIVVEYFSLNNKDFYSFTDDLNIIHLPNKKDFLDKLEPIKKKIKSNKNGDIILCFESGDLELKLYFSLENLELNRILKINDKPGNN